MTAPAAQPLPESVRSRIVALAADCLAELEPGEIPGALRQVARFTPRARARAATPIATALETDDNFRRVVGALARGRQPELAAALETGAPPAAADPADVATLAWLLRSDGWEDLVGAAAAAERDATQQAGAAAESLARLREQLATTRAAARSENARLREDLTAARSEIERLRRELRQEHDRAESAVAASQQARDAADAAVADATGRGRTADAELRRLRSRLTEAESALEAARRAGRDNRAEADTRLRLLLDAVTGAAQGLARELALPPVTVRPGDVVSGASTPTPSTTGANRAAAADDPALLDALLRVPATHLIVDGYNVTKTGYGELPLERQRERLLSGLGGLAARTRAEVTCVFDGATQPGPLAAGGPRGVRVLFSDPGVTADEVIRRLAHAEPEGRPLVVISADREVVEGVERAGATALPSTALLALLGGR